MEPGQQVRARSYHPFEGRDDGTVLLQHEQLLRRVSPPSVRVVQVGYQLRRRLVQHSRLRAIARDPVERQPPDASVAKYLVQLVLLDLLPQIGSRHRPRCAFDHAAVHVGDVENAIRTGGDVDRAEQRIERANELRERIRVLQLREPIGLDGSQATDDAGDDFAMEIVADEICGQPVAAIDLIAGRGGRVDQRAIGNPRTRKPSLDIPNQNGSAPGDVEVGLELLGGGGREVAVMDGKLEVARQAAGAMLEPHFAVVVLGGAPLGTVRPGRFADDPGRRRAHAERVDRAVQPVVHRPEQARRLGLEVAAAAEVRGEQFLLVRDAVAVRIGVLPDLISIRLHGQDGVAAERHREARKEQLVGEHRVMLEDTIVVPILMPGNPADRCDRSRSRPASARSHAARRRTCGRCHRT